MQMFTIGRQSGVCSHAAAQLAELGILEPTHLERWIIDRPEVLGDHVTVVTTLVKCGAVEQ
jgi:hypothetical protein